MGRIRCRQSTHRKYGVAFVIPLLLGMSSDQGPARPERELKAWIVEQFLEKNFTREEIAKNSYILRLQAEILLFHTKPLIIEKPTMYGGQGFGGSGYPGK